MKNGNLSFRGWVLGLGFAWAVEMLVMGWVAALGWGSEFVKVLSSVYLGYEATFFGAVKGAIWGFVDGAIFGLLIVFFHNYFVELHAKRKKR